VTHRTIRRHLYEALARARTAVSAEDIAAVRTHLAEAAALCDAHDAAGPARCRWTDSAGVRCERFRDHPLPHAMDRAIRAHYARRGYDPGFPPKVPPSELYPVEEDET